MELQNEYSLLKQEYNNNNESWNYKYNALKIEMDSNILKYTQLESDYQISNEQNPKCCTSMQNQINKLMQKYNQLNGKYVKVINHGINNTSCQKIIGIVGFNCYKTIFMT